jgi:hypothetical protein
VTVTARPLADATREAAIDHMLAAPLKLVVANGLDEAILGCLERLVAAG